jgi:predicted MFS family arabinose efflux permease
VSLSQDGAAVSAAPARRAWRNGPLGVRSFRLLSIGQMTSTVGDYCYAIALPWLILSSHGGTVMLGIVLACYGVPRTVLIPAGGVLADRLSPRAVMLAADSVRCVLVAALAILAARHTSSLVFLAPVAVLLGAGEGLFLPAAAAIMPSLLPPEQLQAGNGLSSAMIQIGSFAGPVLGGILVAAAGSAPAFAVDAASFAVSAAALFLMRPARDAMSAAGQEPSQPGRAKDAAAPPADETSIRRLFLRSRELQIIVAICVVANFVIAAAFEVALPALAHANFGPAGYGALVACFGAGAVAGTLAAARTTSLRRPAVATGMVFLVAAVAVAVLPFAGGLPGAAAADLAFGATASFGNVVIITVLQRWAPAQLLGRVMSVVMLASIGTFPVSVAFAGFIVHRIGPSPFFPVAGGTLALSIAAALVQAKFRAFGQQPAPLSDQAPDRPPGQAAVVVR